MNIQISNSILRAQIEKQSQDIEQLKQICQQKEAQIEIHDKKSHVKFLFKIT